MSHSTSSKTITVALIGNPNTGKSTLFNALSGARQQVGNYPGVTVEKKQGRLRIDQQDFTLVDLPGSYSLAPRSPDEMISVDVLLGRRDDVAPIDVILCIVDSSNLERNLYLVSQVLEFERPTVLALNMQDVAREKGVLIDVEALRNRLQIPVVEIQANRGKGIEALKQTLAQAAHQEPARPESPFPEAFQEEVAFLERVAREHSRDLPRYLVERLLLDTGGYLEPILDRDVDQGIHEAIQEARTRLQKAGCPAPGVEAMARYGWVSKMLDGVASRPSIHRTTWSDRIDKVLTHWAWGTIAFVLVMLAMFQSVFYIAEPASFMIEKLNGWLAGVAESVTAEGALRSLLVNGVIEGVGGVLVFLPQIFMLFFFIAILEDCGYMARAAYLMDRVMSRVGLSGKSFIPLLSSFACAIPGVMAARVIENPRDRLVTILVAPLMSCSARLPVYTLMIAAFIPDIPLFGLRFFRLPGATMFGMYFLGIATAVVVVFILKKTILPGQAPPFVMELPTYKLPSARMVLHRMLDRGFAFVRRAGTLIFAVTVVVWAIAYFPHHESQISPGLLAKRSELQHRIESLENSDAPSAETLLALAAKEKSAVEAKIAGEYLKTSYLGAAGQFIEPAVKPLGWDWRIGCATIASFPAREVVIATLGVIYNLGEDETDAESTSLQQTLRDAKWDGSDRPVFTIPTALSVMVFFALCAQCAATLATIRRETNSYRWPIFTFVYMTSLAYLGSLATFQIGTWWLAG